MDFINLTPDNIADEHLCCIIRSRTKHPGVEAKRQWLSERIKEGHVFRKLNAKGCCFIEFAPLETAWVPVVGENYYYIYCLWVSGEFKGKGYGGELMEYCISEARRNGRSGVCMLGAKKQKNWLSDQKFAKKYGFEVVDSNENGYELLALSFDGIKSRETLIISNSPPTHAAESDTLRFDQRVPRFTDSARRGTIDDRGLTIYYDMQCPFIPQKIEEIRQYCETSGIPASFIRVDSLEQAKSLPCVFNNWGAFYNGEFQTVNLLDVSAVQKMIEKS